jgi:aryl-alcohol dehydrogenase-like predicted oxidoreductase
MVKTRTFGRTGWQVTELGFGAWAIGGASYGPVEVAQGEQAVETYLDLGGNFIDTANGYAGSEERIGNVLQRRGGRGNVFICSKSPGGGSPDNLHLIREHVELSLRRLQTDYIDLYCLHAPPEDADLMQRALDVYDKLKEEGKVRAVGASIKGPSVTDSTTDLCRRYIDTGRIDSIQLIYSILRQKNAGIFEYASDNGVALVARTSIESGFLSGRYKPGVDFSRKDDNDHRRRWSKASLDKILGMVEEIENFALKAPYDCLAQVAIRFVLEAPLISTCIPGARTSGQVNENMRTANLPSLDDETVERLRKDYQGLEETVNPS